jgi:hypothetical protein
MMTKLHLLEALGIGMASEGVCIFTLRVWHNIKIEKERKKKQTSSKMKKKITTRHKTSQTYTRSRRAYLQRR